MDKLCEECWNDACKEKTEEFRNNKLPVCRHMEENPEYWEDLEYKGSYEEWY